MKTFPTITVNLKEIKQELASIPEIRFAEQPNGTTVCCYIVAAEGTFDSNLAREARGMVFDRTGRIISRPLHKFFNVNERPETHVDQIDWSKVYRVMVKRDGSMIHTVENSNHDNGRDYYWLKSKKSFTSDVVIQTEKWIDGSENKKNLKDFCNTIVGQNKTAIFEWTSPEARIVLPYEQPELTLLHIRCNYTGEYAKNEELEYYSKTYNIPLVAEDIEAKNILLEKGPSALLDHALNLQGVEGWVIQFEDGNMVKLKTKQYLELHRVMTFLRERDVALMVLREQLDDLKTTLVAEGCDLAQVLDIEARVVQKIDTIINSVENTYNEWKQLDRKSFAIKFGSNGENHPFFGLLMSKYTGKEPNYKDYYEKNHLSNDFTLTQLNMKQVVVEE